MPAATFEARYSSSATSAIAFRFRYALDLELACMALFSPTAANISATHAPISTQPNNGKRL